MPTAMSVDAVLIAGPTASGKSALALALALAERLRGAIINCDSMQVYSELRLLSARPTADDESRTPHFLYGHVSAHERYSAGRYQDDAAAALARAREAGRLPIFAGGTGLYFGALLEGLSPIPQVPNELRAQTRRRFAQMGAEAFYAELAGRDPETAAQLRPTDTHRVQRAMDVLEATGRPLSQWRKYAGHSVLAGMRLARFVLAPPREVLYERIDRRFEAMMKAGALEEARALVGIDPGLPAARALGLRPLLAHLAGKTSLEEAVARAQRETRNYAKRQLTWFRGRMADWRWIREANLRAMLVDITLTER
ncbi:MAG: tRNA (adenosine(37)-N6)-dimethylallyltransferase MiaA [Alphaproteobacteria bacterium]